MDEIIIHDGENVKISCENNIFKIEFKTSSYSLINSLINTRIIRSGSTDDMYKTIEFKALSVRTLEQYMKYNMKRQGKNNILISDLAKMVKTLSEQLKYLIEKESCTIIGYNPADIIVINDEKFAFLGSELVANIDTEGNNLATINYPFSHKDFFISPELFNIKELPSKINYKMAYFSFGLLLIYVLVGDDEFYKNYLKDKNTTNILEVLNNHPIKNTRLYWLLSRCLVEEPNNRSILLI